MSMLNLQWASSRKHECGIKQNKWSESVLPSVMLGWVTTFVVHLSTCVVYIPRYACTSLSMKSGFPDASGSVCEFMNKKWFSGLTVSRWPQAGGMYWLGHLFSYKWGAHCRFCVCSSAASSLIRKSFSQHFFTKSAQIWYIIITNT